MEPFHREASKTHTHTHTHIRLTSSHLCQNLCMGVIFYLFLLFCGCYSKLFSCSPTSTNWLHTQGNLYYNRKSTTKNQYKSKWKLDLPWRSYDYWKCMFVGFSTEYTSPPNNFRYRVWSSWWILRHNPISFKHVSLGYLFFDPHQTIQ